MSKKAKTQAMKKDGKAALEPKLRFPEFRDTPGWARRTLGNFLNERNEYPQEPVPLYSLTIEDGVTPKTERYERAFLVKDATDAYKLVLPEDFAFNPMNLRFGAIGRHSGSEAVAVSKYYNIFYCDPTSDAQFCELYFRSDAMIAFYDNMAIGSLIEKRRVHFSDFLKFEIPFPTLAEQQKIAECLSSVAELIAAQARKVDALKTHKKGLMQQLFPREGETQPRLRFPEFQDAGDWKVRKAGSLFTNRKTKGEQGLPIYSVTMHDGMVRRDSLDRNYYDIEDASGNKMARKNDIAYNMMRMWQGAVGVAPEDCLVSPAYIVLAPAKGTDPDFFQFMFKLPTTLLILTAHSRGLTKDRLRLYFDDFARIPLPCPSFGEQQRIADCLSSLEDLITDETQKLDVLKTHKKALMQQLFPSPAEVEA